MHNQVDGIVIDGDTVFLCLWLCATGLGLLAGGSTCSVLRFRVRPPGFVLSKVLR